MAKKKNGDRKTTNDKSAPLILHKKGMTQFTQKNKKETTNATKNKKKSATQVQN